MKTDTQTTPGPWQVENDNRPDSMLTIRSHIGLGIAYSVPCDARLIAAAPELRDALVNAENVFEALLENAENDESPGRAHTCRNALYHVRAILAKL